jgi:hypothetical protein
MGQCTVTKIGMELRYATLTIAGARARRMRCDRPVLLVGLQVCQTAGKRGSMFGRGRAQVIMIRTA